MIKIRNTLYENGDAEIKITPYYPNNKGTVRSDEDRISARNRQRKKRAKDHAMSFKATNFLTLTAPEDSPLRTDINTFMKLADKFLATQEVNYFLYPQFYRGTNEYHIHGLSNGAIDFKKWIELTNANPNNCYCKPLEKSQLDAAEYIISSISPRLKSRGRKYFINKFFFHALCVTMKKRWYTTEHVRVSRYSTQ